jgi:DNA-binding response OmpR family regulator
VPKTLLAVDDSVTMRKVLEITFSGEDFKVITADSSQAALAQIGKPGDKPSVVVIDTMLGSDDGYALAKEVRKREARAAIVMLASRYNPYDQGKGKDSGVDDYIDKPFDTQQLIDKVKKALAARESGVAVAAAASPAAPAAAPKPAPQPMAAQAKPTQQSMGGSARAATMVFGDMAPPPAKQAPAQAAQAARAAPASTPEPARAAPAAAATAVSASVNGNLAGKLSELGLSPQQADAVLALSREVVERVVWEVVPQLAEAIIKEEITRLTKE